jgi:UDP-N-acetylglucosamine 2-epimerase (non-hydrolysing)
MSPPDARGRVLVMFGTRPEAIKLAPVITVLASSGWLEPRVAVTGQHRSLLDEVLTLFQVEPHYDLDLMSQGQEPHDVAAKALTGLSGIIAAEHPDCIVVQGDTTTTLAGALAAFYKQVPVVHVEAGLRSRDLKSPFPEEGNRKLVTHVSSLHLAPTLGNKNNLLAEGVEPARVVVTGNTVIDALRQVMGGRGQPLPHALDADDRRMVLVTMHRRESWGVTMREVAAAVADLARAEPDVVFLVPLHPNPVVRAAFEPETDSLSNVIVTDPLPYGTFVRAMARSRLIITDSGGIQEEGPSLGKPVLVVRETTERPEAIAAGTARLVGTSRFAVADSAMKLLRDPVAYSVMANAVNPYGDGRAAERTVAAIGHLLGSGRRPEDFSWAGATPEPELQSA